MPSKNPAQRLRDIIENIDAIAAFTAGMSRTGDHFRGSAPFAGKFQGKSSCCRLAGGGRCGSGDRAQIQFEANNSRRSRMARKVSQDQRYVLGKTDAGIRPAVHEALQLWRENQLIQEIAS